MGHQETCINSSDRNIHQASNQTSHQASHQASHQDKNTQREEIQTRQTTKPFLTSEQYGEPLAQANDLASDLTSALANDLASDLACSFMRVHKNGNPALLASVSVPVCPQAACVGAEDALPALLRHAEELNIRLPLLKASVRKGTGAAGTEAFVLHGLFCGEVNTGSMANFLERLTQDYQAFLAYTKAHNIQLRTTPAEVSATV